MFISCEAKFFSFVWFKPVAPRTIYYIGVYIMFAGPTVFCPTTALVNFDWVKLCLDGRAIMFLVVPGVGKCLSCSGFLVL